MRGYITNIEKETLENNDYRKVLYTTPLLQLVLMSIEPGDEIGLETHDLDQFIRVEQGKARVILNGEETEIEDDFAVVIPAGTEHNVISIGEMPLKIYSIYTPPEHRHDTVHQNKSDETEEHFDGETSL